jgi:hypothetical protein
MARILLSVIGKSSKLIAAQKVRAGAHRALAFSPFPFTNGSVRLAVSEATLSLHRDEIEDLRGRSVPHATCCGATTVPGTLSRGSFQRRNFNRAEERWQGKKLINLQVAPVKQRKRLLFLNASLLPAEDRRENSQREDCGREGN